MAERFAQLMRSMGARHCWALNRPEVAFDHIAGRHGYPDLVNSGITGALRLGHWVGDRRCWHQPTKGAGTIATRFIAPLGYTHSGDITLLSVNRGFVNTGGSMIGVSDTGANSIRSNGLRLGIGGTDFETTTNPNLIALNESVAWLASSTVWTETTFTLASIIYSGSAWATRLRGVAGGSGSTGVIWTGCDVALIGGYAGGSPTPTLNRTPLIDQAWAVMFQRALSVDEIDAVYGQVQRNPRGMAVGPRRLRAA